MPRLTPQKIKALRTGYLGQRQMLIYYYREALVKAEVISMNNPYKN